MVEAGPPVREGLTWRCGRQHGLSGHMVSVHVPCPVVVSRLVGENCPELGAPFVPLVRASCMKRAAHRAHLHSGRAETTGRSRRLGLDPACPECARQQGL